MDSEILNALYQRYHRELYLYLYSLSHDGPLSEDLLQDTFLKALLALPPGHPNIRAWLYLVARNLYLDHRKRAGRLTSLEERAEPTSGTDEVVDRVLREERYRQLYKALDRLDGRKREILQLQYFSGLSHREIAAILHLTPENARTLASRARRELKAYLEGEHYDLS